MDLGLLSAIERELLTWPGVGKEILPADPTMEARQTDVTVYRVGSRHFGHIHHDGVADIQLTRATHDSLVAAGAADPHRGGFLTVVSHSLRQPADVPAVLDLLHRGYQRATAARARRRAASAGSVAAGDGSRGGSSRWSSPSASASRCAGPTRFEPGSTRRGSPSNSATT